jgi:hypothetical protein
MRLGMDVSYNQFIANNAWWTGSAYNYVNTYGYGGLASRIMQGGGIVEFDTVSGGTNPITWNPRLYISNGGNVGIGTTNPQHLLGVAGTIGAQEIVVASTGADYVFDPGYRLATLTEVADYIEANHHLPEIPSAAEGVAKGVGLGEMQSKLLAKIEELTLHMIQAEKENRELRERIGRLEAANSGK